MQDSAGSAIPLRDIHRQITDRLISAMQAGPGQFVLPWRQKGLQLPTNAATGRSYNGANIVALWVAGQQAGFPRQLWATYKQWAFVGAQVIAGQKATQVLFYKSYNARTDREDEGDRGRRLVARSSSVFNVAQVSGYQMTEVSPAGEPLRRLQQAETFVTATGAEIIFGGDRAYYVPSQDIIRMPSPHAFIGTHTMDRREAYYATLIHELVHWSGAVHRLNRDLSGRFGGDRYAAEELVAELGAAFLCSELSITQDVRPDHAQYLASWLGILRADTRAIFTAAARASDAAHYLRGLGAARGQSQPALTSAHQQLSLL